MQENTKCETVLRRCGLGLILCTKVQCTCSQRAVRVWRLFTRLLEIIHDIPRLCFRLYWLLLQPVSEQLEKHLKTLDFGVSREIPLRGQKVIR